MHWSEELAAWLVTRHDDVRLLLADARVTPDPRAYERGAGAEVALARWPSENPFLGADAARARRLVSTALTPRAVARMEGQVREVVEQYAAPLRARDGVVDLLAEFAAPIPGVVISRITGVPAKGADEERFRELARKVVRGVNPTLAQRKRESTDRATAQMFDYVRALAVERVAAPREDLVSDLIAASEERSPRAIEEIVRVVAALVSTGTEATAAAAAHALRTLLRHPDQLERLRSDRALLPDAVEELLRFDSGLSEMPRYALEDFELRGRSIRKGQMLVLSLSGAHRDPRAFDASDALDLGRSPRNLVAFGYGSHHCIGAPLARTELRLLIDAALDFLPPSAVLLEEQMRWSARVLTGRIKSLPVEFRRS